MFTSKKTQSQENSTIEISHIRLSKVHFCFCHLLLHMAYAQSTDKRIQTHAIKIRVKGLKSYIPDSIFISY